MAFAGGSSASHCRATETSWPRRTEPGINLRLAEVSRTRGAPPHPHTSWLPIPKCVPLPWTPKVLPNISQRPRGMLGNKNLQDPLGPITTHPCHPARAPSMYPAISTGCTVVRAQVPVLYIPAAPCLTTHHYPQLIPTPSQTLPRPSTPRC